MGSITGMSTPRTTSSSSSSTAASSLIWSRRPTVKVRPGWTHSPSARSAAVTWAVPEAEGEATQRSIADLPESGHVTPSGARTPALSGASALRGHRTVRRLGRLGHGNNAVEVHVFPEEMRGTGEGSRPFDLRPNSTMTNATVAESVTMIPTT